MVDYTKPDAWKQAAKAAPKPAPRSAALLAGKLNTIGKYGTPDEWRKAQGVAKGGSPSIGARLLQGVSFVAGAPMRAVAGVVEEAAEDTFGHENDRDFWKNLTDPNYGVGHIVEQFAPDANPWVKRGAGLAGDILLDPLTYATFGASAAVKTAGRGAGLARIALEGADVARLAGKVDEADKLYDLASRVGKAAWKVDNIELDELAALSGKFKPGELRYGVGWNIPFAKTSGTVPGQISEKIGRGLESGGGRLVRSVRDTKLGDKLGGNLGLMKAEAASGDPIRARIGRRVLDAVGGGTGRSSSVERQLTEATARLEREGKKAGLTGEEINIGLSEAPTTVNGVTSMGGPTYERLMADPVRKPYFEKWLEVTRGMPEYLQEAARYGDQNLPVVHDATEVGRPYALRVMSDEYREFVRSQGKTAGQRGRTVAPEEVWLQKKALTVGDKMGEGADAVEILRPGTKTPEGQLVPSIEQQISDYNVGRFGEGAINWYEPDFYKAWGKYKSGVAEATKNRYIENYLHAKGISNEKYTYLLDGEGPGKRRLTIKEMSNKAAKVMAKYDTRTQKALARLDAVNKQLDDVKVKVADGRISVDEAQVEVQKLTRQKQAAARRVQQIDTDLPGARRRVIDTAIEENRLLDQADAIEAEVKIGRSELDRLSAAIKQADTSEEAWPELQRLVAERDAAEARHAQLVAARERVPRLYETTARNYAVAHEIEQAMAEGGMDPMSPLYDMVEKVADQMDLDLADPATLPTIATMLRGSVDRDMEELARYLPGAPATGNVQQLRGEAGGAKKRMAAAGRQMIDAVDQESFDVARQAYEQAAQEYSHRRVLLDMHREYGGAPNLANMEEAQVGAVQQAIETQVALTQTLATPKERAAASLANQQEQWAAQFGPEGPSPVANPAGGHTWFHGFVRGPVTMEGQFPLESAMDGIDLTWMDHLHGPSTSSNINVPGVYVEGDPRKVQELIFNSRPERVRVYGPNPEGGMVPITPGDVGDVSRQGVGPELGGQIDQLDPEGLSQHVAGPPYELYRTDQVGRLADEYPELIDGLLDLDHLDEATADAFRAARQLQDYSRGIGRPLTFTQTLELVGSEGTGPHLFDLLDDPLTQLPGPDDYLPYASDLANAVFDDTLPAAWRRSAYMSMRDSMARDYDVIVFANEAGQNVADFNHPSYVHAMPTNQFTMDVTNPLVEGEPLEGAAEAVSRVATSYSGKHIDQVKLDDLTKQLAQAQGYVRTVTDQFTAKSKDVSEAAAKRLDAQRKLHRLTAAQDPAAVQLAEKEALLGQAHKAFTARTKALTEAEARMHNLEGKAAKLESLLVGYDNTRQAAQSMADRVKALKDSLGQAWEGFGYNREAPALVNELLADMNRSYDPVSGQGLAKFLRGFDHVNGWMKGWLTSSVGFQTRNMFGGEFNNWLAGVDLIRSGREWGDIYFNKMTPKAVRKAKAAALAAGKDESRWMEHIDATPWQVATHRIGDDAGVVRSGLFTSELGLIGTEGVSVNPAAGIAGGNKSFVLPYLTRKMGEQATEPFLRGQLYYDRLWRSVERGRFAELGIHKADDVTFENMEQFIEAVKTSPLMSEVTDDINKYHFNYDDLSRFERQVGRRLIPFYTWTRKNVPLQVEALATQPGKALNRYMAVKRNLELGTEEEGIVPSYFAEQGMIHLPWSTGGGDLYGTVELPFKDPFKVADVSGQLQGMLNPLIKAPLEVMRGAQFFNDVPITHEYKEMPTTWAPLIPFFAATGSLPFTPWAKPEKNVDGTWMMRDSDMYLVQQYLPFFAQTRRLLPSEDKYENRLWSTLASYMMGVNLRTNTPQDMESELFRRADTLGGVVDVMEATGRIPAKPPSKPRRQTGPDLATLLESVQPATPTGA